MNFNYISDNLISISIDEKDEKGNYYVDGFWSENEKIGILFKPLN